MNSARIKDVAALASVSIGTVSNVLNRPQLVAPETVKRVEAAMEELAYVPNEAARQLRLGHSHTLGVITPDASNPFFADVTVAAEKAAAEAGYTVIVGNSNGSLEREAGYLELFEKLRVRGVLVAPVGESTPRLAQMRGRGTPAVLVGTDGDASCSSVSVDDAAGAAIAVDHLVRTGRRRLAFVGGPLAMRQVSNRFTGASRAVRKYAAVSLEHIELREMTVEEGRAAGRQLAQRRAADRPDGVFAANDLLAIGLAASLFTETRAASPEQMGLVGYDDITFAASSTVPLSSVRQPTELIARAAIDLLLQDAEYSGRAPRHVLYQPELVIRASSAATPMLVKSPRGRAPADLTRAHNPHRRLRKMDDPHH
ncbi:LacI family DNA-binding transcriptional regulator [Leifsonia sp. 22587]|uniref:LacI family DNA-binding transcriptional regulator n=1 Tax=Leifsonia sp. 22587 TaxID=3453946 RepID=UPI003F8471AF